MLRKNFRLFDHKVLNTKLFEWNFKYFLSIHKEMSTVFFFNGLNPNELDGIRRTIIIYKYIYIRRVYGCSAVERQI